ncbi:MAG: methyltransferase domain-containing protein [Candidatus Azobacteroides sp.]|nr:methyltransferase domain-containing protein [Candidatus Azobacteroides sp.]
MKLQKQLKRFLKKIYYYGNKYYCPNCNSSLRDFIFCGIDSLASMEKQIIGGGRRKRECPICHSAERDRLVYLYVRDYLHLFSNQNPINILHIAPEDCLYPVFYKKINHQNYICGDKFEKGYSYDPQRVQYMDITAIPYEDHSFDLILCNHVLEHIPDDRKAMRELYRVLKSGGKAILQVPLSILAKETYEDFSITDPEERFLLFGQRNHCRIYGQDYGKRLKEAGFEFCPVKIDIARYPKFGLDEREKVMVAAKK